MADPPEAAMPNSLVPTGPDQFGRGKHGQYVHTHTTHEHMQTSWQADKGTQQ